MSNTPALPDPVSKHSTTRIDWRRPSVQTIATLFACALLGFAQYFAQPSKGLAVPLTYSLAIGGITATLIQLGAHFLKPKNQTLIWNSPKHAIPMLIVCIVLGFVAGTFLGDAVFGWSSWSNERFWRFSLTLSIACSLGFCFVFYSLSKAQEMAAELAELKAQAVQAQLKLIETQLDPHLLFNTLANLRVLIKSDPERAQHMLDHTVDFLRASLNGSRSTSQSLKTEFERLEHYLELMAIRMGNRLSYRLNLPEALAHWKVPSLMLQPLVENAIKHGLEPLKLGGQVQVSASEVEQLVRLTVSNTGSGGSSNLAQGIAFNEGTGFGLEQLRLRLNTYFSGQALLDIRSDEVEGTQVVIDIPISALQARA